MDNVPICTVDVIILNKKRDKLLLFKRTNEPLKGVYFTIGGRLYKGESYLQCAMRQAARELGIAIDPRDATFVGTSRDTHENSAFENISYDAVVILFSYVLDDEDQKFELDEQHDGYRWFSIDDSSLHPLIKERIGMAQRAFRDRQD